MPLLEELRISDNMLSGDDLHYLQQYPLLKFLDISNNQIKQMDHMLQLKVKLNNFVQINLSANPVQEQAFYRENFYEKLP